MIFTAFRINSPCISPIHSPSEWRCCIFSGQPTPYTLDQSSFPLPQGGPLELEDIKDSPRDDGGRFHTDGERGYQASSKRER